MPRFNLSNEPYACNLSMSNLQLQGCQLKVIDAKQQQNIQSSKAPGTCSHCGKIAPQLRCSRCKLTKYCSQRCQKADWSQHKHKCQNTIHEQQKQPETQSLKISDELLTEIFRRLSVADLTRCLQISKNWQKLALENSIWNPYRILKGYDAEKNLTEYETVKYNQEIVQNKCYNNYKQYKLHEHAANVESLKFLNTSTDDKLIISTGWDGIICVWNYQTIPPKLHWKYHAHQNWICSIALNKKYIATGGLDTQLLVFEIDNLKQRPYRQFKHPCNITALTFVPQTTDCVLSGGIDGIVRVFDVPSGQLLQCMHGASGVIWGIVCSLQHKGRIFSCGQDSNVLVYETDLALTNRGEWILPNAYCKGHSQPILCWDACQTCDGGIYIQSKDCIINTTLNLQRGNGTKEQGQAQGYDYEYDQGQGNMDGWLATGGADQDVRLWNMNTLECVQVIESYDFGILQVKFHIFRGKVMDLPVCTECAQGLDSLLLISSAQNGMIRVFEVAMGVQLLRINAPHIDRAVSCLYLNGNFLYSLSMQNKYYAAQIELVFQRKNRRIDKQHVKKYQNQCSKHILEFKRLELTNIETTNFGQDFQFDSCLLADKKYLMIGTKKGEIIFRNYAQNSG
eukprot:TRINITY_DN9491_c0_g1_i4.p1 TRINITY_DN9491_c0_g1~~TRINITY_DN9491_c0_g1_i4.p1  ORF type:complete len:643 (-),score=33.87 TRINITY_DN9491_c0_g1_i4:367-2235(-)